jgi:hypothetical protein
MQRAPVLNIFYPSSATNAEGDATDWRLADIKSIWIARGQSFRRQARVTSSSMREVHTGSPTPQSLSCHKAARLGDYRDLIATRPVLCHLQPATLTPHN